MRVERTTSGGESRRATDTWAARLARRRSDRPETPSQRPADLLPEAIAALWALFDEAQSQANASLAQAGLADRIAVRRTLHARRYAAPRSDDPERSISVSLSLQMVDGQICGGATIGTSQTRSSIFLTLATRGGKVGWYSASGKPFTRGHVQDLFLSVFADDPGATSRLSPLSGCDLFEEPWC